MQIGPALGFLESQGFVLEISSFARIHFHFDSVAACSLAPLLRVHGSPTLRKPVNGPETEIQVQDSRLASPRSGPKVFSCQQAHGGRGPVMKRASGFLCFGSSP